MIKLKNLIERIFKKKNIKVFLLLFIIIGFFVGTSFADTTSVTKDVFRDFSNILRILISILSWGWIILASLAGKLMTNELVYGTFLNLDKALWNLWNIIKNFSNFILGFILLFSIVKNIFTVIKSDADPLKNAINTVKNVLIAGVLVQMSWFLVGITLDLSTIATAVVGSVPSQIIANNSSDLQKHLNGMIKSKQVKLEVDFNQADIVNSTRTGELNEDELRQIIDTITPSANSVIGPLIFLGGSVFDLFEASDTSHIESNSVTWSDLFLTLGVNGFVIITFTVMMAFIFLFNLFRVITLWVIIPLSPFIILVKVLDPKGEKLKLEGFLSETLSLKNVFNLIFKPVYMVLVLSVVLIVMTIVKGLVTHNNGNFTGSNYGNVNITSTKIGEGDDSLYNSSLNVDGFLDLTLNGTKNTIVDLMVYILGLILMFMLMKSCITSKTGFKFIDEKISELSGALWGDKPGELGGLLGSMGVVPIGNGEKVGLSKMRDFRGRVLNDGTRWASAVGIDFSKQDDAIERLMGGSSFKSLINAPSKKAWIESAIAMGKSKGYSNSGMLIADNKFDDARLAWNAKWKMDSTKRVDTSEIKDAWATGKYEPKPSTQPSNGNNNGGNNTQNTP